jgi:hypothetical protein
MLIDELLSDPILQQVGFWGAGDHAATALGSSRWGAAHHG